MAFPTNPGAKRPSPSPSARIPISAVRTRTPSATANLLKYAFGIDLHDPDRSNLPASEIENDRFVFSFSRLQEQSDIQYQIEISSNLIDWTLAGELFSEVAVEDQGNGRTERVTLESDPGVMSNGRNFVRIQIGRP